MRAFVFPGQGSQFAGMGKDLYETYPEARHWFEEANSILDFRITDVMFEGTEEELKQTRITQPAIFLHSVIMFKAKAEGIKPAMVAGHSLGEFSALVVAGTLSFSDGLELVFARAQAMQRACGLVPSAMAAVIGLDDETIEKICAAVPETVAPANYNCPGQVVISGSIKGIELASEQLKAAGAKRVLKLNVAGAFHSPLMEPAQMELQQAIERTEFHSPSCPIYQNVNAHATTHPSQIRANLLTQLTAPVRWTQSVLAMIKDGATVFTECGPGKVLQGLIGKINSEARFEELK